MKFLAEQTTAIHRQLFLLHRGWIPHVPQLLHGQCAGRGVRNVDYDAHDVVELISKRSVVVDGLRVEAPLPTPFSSRLRVPGLCGCCIDSDNCAILWLSQGSLLAPDLR